MPKYYCDYCDTFLTHDSRSDQPSVRKTHCNGRKHKENVRLYYQKWLEEQVQKLVDNTTAAFKSGKIQNNPFQGNQPGHSMVPPPPQLQGHKGPPGHGPPGGMGGGMPPPMMGHPGPMMPGKLWPPVAYTPYMANYSHWTQGRTETNHWTPGGRDSGHWVPGGRADPRGPPPTGRREPASGREASWGRNQSNGSTPLDSGPYGPRKTSSDRFGSTSGRNRARPY